MHRLK